MQVNNNGRFRVQDPDDLIMGRRVNAYPVVNSTNDLQMVSEGLRKPILQKDAEYNKKSDEERNLIKLAKAEEKKIRSAGGSIISNEKWLSKRNRRVSQKI